MFKTAYDSIEYPMYKDFKHIQAAWLADDRNIFDLTTDEINNLIAIADSSKGTAGAQARSILLFAYDTLYSYVDCPGMPGSSNKSTEINGKPNTENGGLFINARPNPASNTVTFSYTLPDGVEKAVLKLFNTSGRLIYKRILHNDEYEFIYNCSNLNQGVYYYFVSSHNDKVSGKLVIVR